MVRRNWLAWAQAFADTAWKAGIAILSVIFRKDFLPAMKEWYNVRTAKL